MDENLTGNYLVRALRPAFQEAHRCLPRMKDRAELRRHALRLRFWPEQHPEDDAGQVLDLDWSWLKSMPGKKVGELRIHDTIDDRDNLRVIFFVPGVHIPNEPLPMLWVLSVLQKKRQDFTQNQIKVYKLRRLMVLERFYHQ